jgi:hypothetical protein
LRVGGKSRELDRVSPVTANGEIWLFANDWCLLDDRIRCCTGSRVTERLLCRCMQIADKNHIPDTISETCHIRVPREELLLGPGNGFGVHYRVGDEATAGEVLIRKVEMWVGENHCAFDMHAAHVCRLGHGPDVEVLGDDIGDERHD